MNLENKLRRSLPALVAKFVLFTLSVFLTLGFLEYSARILTDRNTLQFYKPIVSKIDPKSEDWRWTQSYNDNYFTSDYELIWKPRAGQFPFDDRGSAISEQFVSYRDPSNQPKILIYGDSNTQGLATNSWPNELQLLLLSHRNSTEVMNRGVAGYSSYQGVKKLKQDLDYFKPKIVIFSFGWNDAAPSTNVPDSYFKPYPMLGGNILAQSRAYAVGIYYGSQLQRRLHQDTVSHGVQPRVSKEEYIQNIKNAYLIAEQHGATPIILTRPYDHTDPSFTDETNWRIEVPKYDDALRELMKNDPKHFIDVEEFFKGKTMLMLDECHFIPDGHRKAAALILDHLLQYQLL